MAITVDDDTQVSVQNTEAQSQLLTLITLRTRLIHL